MKTKSKALLLTLCAVLLVAASVLGTMAYLTDSDKVENTFTVGKVDISLDEAEVNADGKAIDKDGKEVTDLAAAKRVTKNSYKLMPGHSYVKDPTVTVKAGSEASYVRMLVTVKFDKVLTEDQLATKLDDIFTGYDVASWNRPDDPTVATANEGEENAYTTITYVYYYKDKVAATTADTKLPALFTGITVPGAWTNADLAALGNIQINIVAQAIQADGFTATEGGNTAEENAWAAFPAT